MTLMDSTARRTTDQAQNIKKAFDERIVTVNRFSENFNSVQPASWSGKAVE